MDNTGGEKADLNAKASENADPIFDEVLGKILEAENVLVALSNDPTVDEIAAAMGLSMVLDAAGKHVTAIYSGKTPNVLEFLKPRDRFETGTESLQDFVIALNKDKADHLRYKIDGDFVKVYVTPYKSTISGDDIEFSRGDFNVDLVISLNVPATTELDAALKEYGRIMHDATSVNITNNAGGNFGDVEWVDSTASSISEMVSKLAFAISAEIDSSAATALLTGLVAATDRFKNPATTPEAMALAAKLMGAGADQQLVVQNVQGEVVFNGESEGSSEGGDGEKDATKLEINHEENEGNEQGTEEVSQDIGESEQGTVETEPAVSEEPSQEAPAEEPQIQTGGGITINPISQESEISTDNSETGEKASNLPEGAVLDVDGTISGGTEESTQPEGEVSTGALSGEAGDTAMPKEDTLSTGATEPAGSNEAVNAAMAEAMSVANSANEAVGTDAGAQEGYQGGEIADKILNNIEKENSNVGSADYGKMIDEALSEPLPGEGGIQVGTNGPEGLVTDTQDVDKANVPEGNMMAMAEGGSTAEASNAGAPMMGNAGAGEIGMSSAQSSDMSEEEAMSIIKQGQQSAGTNEASTPANEREPQIITGAGAGFGETPMNVGGGNLNLETNPAMTQTPSIGETEATGVPEMNFQTGNDTTIQPEPSAMPMPGQEIAPPPVAPMPDFGTMPPMGVNPVQNESAMPVLEPAQMSSATVQPDVSMSMNSPVSTGADALPQMPQVAGGGSMGGMATGASTFQTPNPVVDTSSSSGDPGAFKIPGIHT